MKSLKWSLSFYLVLLMFAIIGCKDDDCQCGNANTELKASDTCGCTDDFYQLGNFSDACDDIEERGICFEKEVNTYMMTSDCHCTAFTAYDSAAVELDVFITFANKRTISSATSTEGTYMVKTDGNEFEYKNIKSVLPDFGDECIGNYIGLQGFMKGKFNAENTFCETKIYWRFDETGENRDSCVVVFRK